MRLDSRRPGRQILALPRLLAPRALLTPLRRLFFEKEVMRLMGLNLMVRPLGLATQMLIAAYFGAGQQYDAYAFAFFLGTFLESSLGRVYTGVLIPATIRKRRELAHDELMAYQNAAFLLFLAPGLVLTAIVMVWPAWLVDLVGPNLPPGTREFTIRFLPWMALGGVGLLAATMGKAILNLNRRFGLAGAMPILQAGVALVFLALFHNQLGIWSLVVGFAVSNVIQLAVQAVGGERFHLVTLARPRISGRSLRQLWTLGWGFMAAQFMMTIQVSVDKIFATGLPTGSISSITYAMTIINMGVQLFNLSLVVVMFTRLSEYLASGQNARGGVYFQANLERVCRLVIPVTVGMSVASGEIVRVLFQRGAFDAADAARTSTVLSIYLLAMPALIFNPMLGRIFHSLQRMRDKVWLTAQYLATQVGGNLLLVGPLGVRGLAVSAVFSINLHVALVLLVLHKLRLNMGIGGFAVVIARSYLLGGLSWLAYRFSGVAARLDALPFGPDKLGLLLTAAARVAFIFAVYMVLLYIATRIRRPGPPADAPGAATGQGGEKA